MAVGIVNPDALVDGSHGQRAVAREVADDALAVTAVDDGVRIRDPDGHYVTLVGN